MPTLTFDPEKHAYYLDGERLLGVTTVLREAKLFDYKSSYDGGAAMERGTAIHALTELEDNGALIPENVPNPLMISVDGWTKFKEDTKIEILGSEEAVYHPLYKYAGTLDRRVLFRGREAVIDIKTGIQAPWHSIQTAAYAKCFNRPLLRYALYIAKGSYTLIEHSNPDDWDVFRSALNIVRWKQRMGIVKVGV
jgi:hypothetical protein